MNKCTHCGEAEATVNDLYCQPCADEIGKAYMQEFELYQLRQLVGDFMAHITKHHLFWEDQRAERETLISRAVALKCEVPA